MARRRKLTKRHYFGELQGGRWWVVVANNQRQALANARETEGRGQVALVRRATPEEIVQYTSQHGGLPEDIT